MDLLQAKQRDRRLFGHCQRRDMRRISVNVRQTQYSAGLEAGAVLKAWGQA